MSLGVICDIRSFEFNIEIIVAKLVNQKSVQSKIKEDSMLSLFISLNDSYRTYILYFEFDYSTGLSIIYKRTD